MYRLRMIFSLLCIFASLVLAANQSIPDEKWSYVNVRKNAYMFWWFYGAQTVSPDARLSKPLIMWIQGGPGASGTGFGNFEEIGPLDIHGNTRNYTWLKAANVLFVDNPVGTGFSYVTEDSAYTTDVSGIAADLLTMFKSFLEDMPVFKNIPFYIFCESYGGKMTSAFGVALHDSIKKGEIKVVFKGVALGDSWISPVDTVMSWGSYLYSFSLLDQMDLKKVNDLAKQTEEAVNAGEYDKATQLWSTLEAVISDKTDGVNVYNVLQHNVQEPFQKILTKGLKDKNLEISYALLVKKFQQQQLSDFMNGPIRKKLGIIPDDVTWGGQSTMVFSKQSNDFMRATIKEVSQLINTSLLVVVYEGQLDMICCTIGAETWVNKLDWTGLKAYNAVKRVPLYPPSQKETKNTGAFVKEYENFHFYTILKAGHMVPLDAPEMALSMVEKIIASEKSQEV